MSMPVQVLVTIGFKDTESWVSNGYGSDVADGESLIREAGRRVSLGAGQVRWNSVGT